MSFKNILFLESEGIATVIINRPEKLNALNFETLEEIREVFKLIESKEEVRAVIITGKDEKAFVAGADINEIANLDGSKGKEIAEKGQEVFFQIENCSKPVIAAVNGYALGGGCELAMACHIRIASENAVFGQPEINLGIIPGYGGTQRLTQIIGKGKAIELMCTAASVDAQTAAQLGLVNYVVPQIDLIPACKDLLQRIINKPRIALEQIIKAANAVHDSNKNGFETEANAFGKCCETGDFKEGTSAFLEKRKPKFS